MEGSPLILPVDGRQSETAFAVQRGVCRLMREHGFAVITEFSLASGRRADVFGVRQDGFIWIVEIKSSLEDYRADQKWNEYRDYCDRFSFAIPLAMDAAIIPVEAGLVVADQYGAEIVRVTDDHPLHASRRKAVTLQFGRVAAQRLHGLYDPLMM
ncbi:MmcB family DNA repair protein [Aestuariivirga sp.]|uniref:MmcB family DNA repair protein n=1 Tax=Aestuariivirga sp. TaxID=2650926 RepID=UPI0039E51B5B